MFICNNSIRVDPGKAKTLQEWPRIEFITDVRQFPALLGFFRRFMLNFAKITNSLTNFTRKGPGVHHWDNKCGTAYEILNTEIMRGSIFKASDSFKKFRRYLDAS